MILQYKDSKDRKNNDQSLISPNINYKTDSFNSIKKELQLNNKEIKNETKPIKANINIKDLNISKNINDTKEHPLLFYALGKVNKEKINNDNFPLYTSQGFRSSSNNLIKRNLFSINSSCFDELKKKKEYSTIKKQKLGENDYIKNFRLYNSFHKFDVYNNCLNQETFNLAKKKFYSRDRFSNIKKGLLITKKEFNEQKNRLINKGSKSIDFKEKRIELSFNKNKNLEKNENLYQTINTETNINNKYFFKDPNDYTKEELKSKEWRFDRNYKKFIKHKNWWLPNK